jgi:hypothetical protein
MSGSEEESDSDRIIELINVSDDDEDYVMDVEDSDEHDVMEVEDSDDEDYLPVAIYQDALSGYNEPRRTRSQTSKNFKFAFSLSGVAI